MKKIPNKDMLGVALSVARHLHENPHDSARHFPDGTRFTPIRRDDGTVEVLVESPAKADRLERVAVG